MLTGGIWIGVGTIILGSLISFWLYRRHQGKERARNWYGGSIEILSRFIAEVESHITSEEDLDAESLVTELEPYLTEIRVQTQKEEARVKNAAYEKLDSIQMIVDQFDKFSQVHAGSETSGEAIERQLGLARKIAESSEIEIDLDLPPDEAFAGIEDSMKLMGDPGTKFDIEKMEEAMKQVDIEYEAEIGQLMRPEMEAVLDDEKKPKSLAAIFDFPFEDFSEFDEFDKWIEPGVQVSQEEFARIMLYEVPISINKWIKKERKKL